MLRALIYTRVSQDRAAGRSPAEQEHEARAVCEREGWQVVEVVTDSVGASRHSKGKRTGWERAKALLASGDVDVLVTWEASRAQRDLSAYIELRDLCVAHGVRWSYSGRTSDLADAGDRFRSGLDALLAEREADEIAGRVRRAMRANAQQGKPHGRRLFGYRRTYDPDTGALTGQEPHPDEAPVVARIFADYLSGRGVRTIARDLNAAGFTTNAGKAWNDVQVRRVLVNPHYAARRVHRGEVLAGDWPSLVTGDIFERTQARLAAMRTGNARQSRTTRLLSGVARCGVCGAKMGVIHDRNARKVYTCKAAYHVSRDMLKLDAYVGLWMVRRLAVGDLDDDAVPAAAVLARQRAAMLRARLDAAVAEFTAGRLTAPTLARIEADLGPQIAEAEAEARRALTPLAIDVPTDNLAAWWQNDLTPEQRRALVMAHISAVVVNPTRRGSRTFDESAVHIDPQTRR